MFVRLDAPAMVSLFAYDNDKFIVESFNDNPVQARIITDGRITKLHDLVTGEELTGQTQAFGGGRGGQAPAGAPAGQAGQAPGSAAGGRAGQAPVAAGGGRGGQAPGGRGGATPTTTFDVSLTHGSYRVFSGD
jgi:hypothetical protein